MIRQRICPEVVDFVVVFRDIGPKVIAGSLAGDFPLVFNACPRGIIQHQEWAS
jgi:hypothetical protein